MPSTGETSPTAGISGLVGTPSAAQDAAALATFLLQGVGSRLDHSAGVAHRVGRAARVVEPEWRSALEAAVWLHNIGYSPELALTGFHPLDGARWLRAHSWPTETCGLIAWHAESVEEARVYGLDRELAAEFDRPPRLASAALAWADLTSSPAGERWNVERRLADILERYPPGSIVHEATRASLPALRAAVREIQELLGGQR